MMTGRGTAGSVQEGRSSPLSGIIPRSPTAQHFPEVCHAYETRRDCMKTARARPRWPSRSHASMSFVRIGRRGGVNVDGPWETGWLLATRFCRACSSFDRSRGSAASCGAAQGESFPARGGDCERARLVPGLEGHSREGRACRACQCKVARSG
ncbi:hypothetical protein PYCCODRAFT_350427 [Trametes coccinea BRFM310]|uniref:Uncharacterized protein n=1 Tax=Trametes coccinea (strain BRFM310) TaxID=1353009 RepID=A0A1Y2J2Z3_TRAC3|nr:hypothetical protein PYCCODRAFT_350427 [Trametes coccinea BRFM310]